MAVQEKGLEISAYVFFRIFLAGVRSLWDLSYLRPVESSLPSLFLSSLPHPFPLLPSPSFPLPSSPPPLSHLAGFLRRQSLFVSLTMGPVKRFTVEELPTSIPTY